MLCESAPVIVAIPLERVEIPLPKLVPSLLRAEDREPRAFDTVDVRVLITPERLLVIVVARPLTYDRTEFMTVPMPERDPANEVS